ELPEVEVAKRCLEQWMLGRTIVRARAPESRVLAPSSLVRLRRRLAGARVTRLDRLGKHIVATFDGGLGMHLHLGMTGRLIHRTAADRSNEVVAHARMTLELDDGAVIIFSDPRMFGVIEIDEARVLNDRLKSTLGPDPLHESISGQRLIALFARTR